MERKIAAILAADVVGYSALMEADEAGTFDRVRMHRKELFEPLGMKDAGFGAPGSGEQVDQPWGHSDKTGTRQSNRGDNPAALDASDGPDVRFCDVLINNSVLSGNSDHPTPWHGIAGIQAKVQ